MTSRRKILAAAGGLILGSRRGFAKASQPATGVNFTVPPNACDSHTHIFGDPARFPFWSGRIYTPETARPNEMAALHRALKMTRVVIVTPSVYGTDNSATIYGMKARGANARGIAVIDGKTPDTELETMNRLGIRGIRLNLTDARQSDPVGAGQLFQAALKRIRRLNWHVQMNTSLAVISGIKDLIMASPVPVVFDHFASTQGSLGMQQRGFGDLTDLVRSGKAYVKVSGVYRVSKLAPDYPDMTPIAQSLVAANPDRILWGSDWPHPNPATPPGHQATDVTPFFQVDDGHLLNLLAVWVPDPVIRNTILVTNPARLYDF